MVVGVVRGVILRSSGRLRRELSIEPQGIAQVEQGFEEFLGEKKEKMRPPRALHSSRIYSLARLKYSHT